MSLLNNLRHGSKTHERWKVMRRMWSPRYRRLLRQPYDGTDWIENQCMGCRYYIPLEGRALGMDWGACTSSKSKYDGMLRFEHDGCEAYEE